MAERSGPFDGLEELLERLNRQLETAARNWESELDTRSRLDLSMGGSSMALDLADNGDEFVVTVDVPGYDGDDIDLRLRGETLEISGDREREYVEEDEETTETATETYLRRERETQSFSRQVQVPDPVDADDVTATVNNGVLTVRLPKREPADDTRTIDIE